MRKSERNLEWLSSRYFTDGAESYLRKIHKCNFHSRSTSVDDSS